ncbi:hypothetical protein [Pseudoxanthomonas sp. JBR18]|uniref:hypothetical protein n=1 Tax=Pseudoxanthomonas sp. JBR18 TaxID=2969308 RepID=UPI002305906F|nr:hypothetical protein [Pseudoxanthomonas sp. JBR18]WCE02687.1 hypothetical protein PJ250_11050 [Pseudoxanthomonas sp. JBR18]
MSVRPSSLLGMLLALCCVGTALADQAAPAADGVLVSEGTLDGYTGRYAAVNGLALEVWHEGSTLMLRPAGGGAVALVADSETVFHASGQQARVEFVFGANDRVSHLLLTQGGTTLKAIRQ